MKKLDYLHVEISNLCNAACPACPRYFNNSPLLTPGLVQNHITVEQFKEWFPPDVLTEVKFLNFCGNHGDPGTAKDFLPIIKYLSQFEFQSFSIHTNGGMKTPKVWREVGEIFAKKRGWEIIFSIDGLEDTNHIYRRNVNWKKLMANVEAANVPGNDNKWEYLIFKHNEHQIGEARTLSKKLRFGDIVFKKALNLDDGNKFTYIPAYKKDGTLDYKISPPDNKDFRNRFIEDQTVFDVNKDFKIEDYNRFLDFPVPLPKTNEIDIADKVAIEPKCVDELYVDANGNVFPCCFVGVIWPHAEPLGKRGKFHNLKNKQLYEQYQAVGKEKYNLYHTTLREVMEKDVMESIFHNNWNKSVNQGKNMYCVEFCGNPNALDCLWDLKETGWTDKLL